ncbi:MAG: hypothetical protein ACOZQL_10315 [Myxococcota bacterium]
MLLSLGLTLTVALGGFVSDAPRAATLIDRELLAQVAPPPPMPASASPVVDHEALRYRLAQLKANEPGIAGPIVLLVTGALAAVAGVVFSYVGLLVFALTASPVLLIPGLLVLFSGVGMTIGGAVWLGGSIRERNRHRREVRQLEQQLEAGEHQPDQQPPPPPMPPPAVSAPMPTLLLAAF